MNLSGVGFYLLEIIMNASSIKCGCVVKDRSHIDLRLESHIFRPCLKYDVENTHDYFSQITGFRYRGQSIYDIAEELNKCVDYAFFHFTRDLNTMKKVYTDSKIERVRKEIRTPLDKIPFLFEKNSLWNSRIRAILSDLDGYDFCISPAEIIELNGLTLEEFNKVLRDLKIDFDIYDKTKFYTLFEDDFIYQLQQSDNWIQYNQIKPFYDTYSLPLEIVNKPMPKDVQENWVIDKVTPWFNEASEARYWYENEIIPSLGRQSPRQLINLGKFDALKYHLISIELGGYA